jgi:hypothetical protein
MGVTNQINGAIFMQDSVSIILGAAGIFCGLAYLLRQQVKRVRKFQRDDAAKFAHLAKIPYDITSVFNGDRCIYPHRRSGTGE